VEVTPVRVAILLLSALLFLGCSKGESAPAAAGPADISKLTPEEQIAKIENDPSIPPQFKPTAINSIKQKHGIK
jgi:hypothetical protein